MDWTTVLVAFITFIGGSTVTVLVTAYIDRRREESDNRKTIAEAKEIEFSTRRDEVEYYRNRIDENITKVESLEKKVEELTAYIEQIQGSYEQRVGELHVKIDILTTELARANNTIIDLRQEVKDGLLVITELRKEISDLLVARAKKDLDKE